MVKIEDEWQEVRSYQNIFTCDWFSIIILEVGLHVKSKNNLNALNWYNDMAQ